MAEHAASAKCSPSGFHFGKYRERERVFDSSALKWLHFPWRICTFLCFVYHISAYLFARIERYESKLSLKNSLKTRQIPKSDIILLKSNNNNNALCILCDSHHFQSGNPKNVLHHQMENLHKITYSRFTLYRRAWWHPCDDIFRSWILNWRGKEFGCELFPLRLWQRRNCGTTPHMTDC